MYVRDEVVSRIFNSLSVAHLQGFDLQNSSIKKMIWWVQQVSRNSNSSHLVFEVENFNESHLTINMIIVVAVVAITVEAIQVDLRCLLP